MRKQIITSIICLLGIIPSIAQYPCINNITTDPNNASNPQQSAMNFDDAYFENTFNWFDHNTNSWNPIPYTNLSDDPNSPAQLGSGFMLSPFDFNAIPSSQQQFLNPNGNINEIDMLAVDGWELVAVNLGYAPDGSVIPLGSNPHTQIPYILLYNKYRGKLRLFAKTLTGITQPYNAVKVTLEFSQNDINLAPEDYSAFSNLFMLQSNIAQPLDQRTKITRVIAMADHPNNYQKWLHVDYDVAYDPCVCYFRSDIEFDFEFIQSSSIRLAGRAVSVEDDLYDASSSSVNYSNDFLTSLFENPANPLDIAGTVVYGRIDDLVDDYLAKLDAVEQYNSDPKIKRTKAILKLFKSVKNTALTVAVSAVFGPSAVAIEPILKELKKRSIIKDYSISGDVINVDGKKLNDAVKKLLGKEVDKLISKFEKTIQAPSKPTMPSATFTEMSFSGDIQSTTRIEGPQLFNPGTYHQGALNNPNNPFDTSTQVSAYNYPVYNEALGTFALLRTPEVLKFQGGTTSYTDTTYGPSYTLVDTCPGLPLCLDTVYTPNYHAEREFKIVYKLNSNLDYVFNPVLDINHANTSVKAAIVIKNRTFATVVGNTTGTGPNTHYMPGALYNTSENEATVQQYDYISPFVDINCLSDLVSGVGNTYDLSGSNQTINATISNWETSLPDSVWIRFLVDMEFNQVGSDGQPIVVTQVYTYPVNVTVSPSDLIDSSFFNLSDYPDVLVLDSTHFASDTTIWAWDSLIVSGLLTADSGVVVNIYGGNSVTVTPDGQVIAPPDSGEINLSVRPMLPCTTPNPAASIQTVQSFCTSSDYQAKYAEPGYRMLTNNHNEIKQIDLKALYSQDNIIHLSSKNKEDRNQNFNVYDLSGHLLYHNSVLPNSIDMHAFASGIYLFEFTTENGTTVEKVYRR